MAGNTSVVIPYYNNHLFVEAALNSVFNQTTPAKEIIVVNDGSTKQSREFLDKFIEKITIIDNSINQGIATTRNTGVAASSGKFIAFLDADDIWSPEKLSIQEQLLKSNSELSACHTGINIFETEGIIKEQCCNKPLILNFENSRIDSHIVPSSLLIKKTAFDDIGGFDSNILTEDYDFFLSLLTRKHLIKFIPKPLIWFRRANHGNLSGTWQYILKGRMQILQKHWKTLYKHNGFVSLLQFSQRTFELSRWRSPKPLRYLFMIMSIILPSGVDES